jgi:membrane protein implicated in regulation of membrane protease activity
MAVLGGVIFRVLGGYMAIAGNYWLFWFIIGFAFLFLEVLTPGMFLAFFGLGAWTVMAIMFVIPLQVGLQWSIFIILSLVYLVALRRKLKDIFARREQGRSDSLKDPLVADQFIDRETLVIQAISPGRAGMVEFNGTNWKARSRHSLAEGDNARIVNLEDLVLWVEPIDATGPGPETQPDKGPEIAEPGP